MKKRIINTMLVLALALSVCACSSSKEVAVDQTGVKSAAKSIGKGPADLTEVATGDSTATVAANNVAATEASETASATPAAEDYLIYKGVSIVPGGDVVPVINALGTPENTYQYKYCGTEKIAKDYYYEGLEIFTAPDDNGVNRIYMIRALDGQSGTLKGASLCQDIDKIELCYGTPTEQTDDLLTYQFNGFKTYFILDGGSPVVIMYSTLDE